MTMTTNDIKKALYKQKPTAHFNHIRMGNAYYYAILGSQRITFCVPVSDMGEADFNPTMPAQQLNRWIVNEE